MAGVDDVEKVAGLRETQAAGAVGVEQLRQRVGCRHLDGRSARNELPVLREEAHVLVAEFQDIGLGFRELEGLQPDLFGRGLDGGHEARAAAAHGRPLHGRDEILHDHAAVLVALEIDAAFEQWREFARVEIGDRG